MIKKKQQRLFNAVFGFAFMLVGAAAEIYDLSMALAFGKNPIDVYDLVVKFIIPLALIYYGYRISQQQDIQFPNILKT